MSLDDANVSGTAVPDYEQPDPSQVNGNGELGVASKEDDQVGSLGWRLRVLESELFAPERVPRPPVFEEALVFEEGVVLDSGEELSGGDSLESPLRAAEEDDVFLGANGADSGDLPVDAADVPFLSFEGPELFPPPLNGRPVFGGGKLPLGAEGDGDALQGEVDGTTAEDADNVLGTHDGRGALGSGVDNGGGVDAAGDVADDGRSPLGNDHLSSDSNPPGGEAHAPARASPEQRTGGSAGGEPG
mmetsp:Transcript_11402/g.31808  ORF Transcript_11402/g.31808 Transcript_11402/m.31808 type:complete len:245 (-) Transcript_11402:14-748(-)